jgi:tRNA-modifying protein YgfZ
VSGEGALAFLHNLLTADLTEGHAVYAALLTPQGKILHDVFVVPQRDHVWIDVARAQSGDLLKRLLMYRLRAKLEIVPCDDKAVAVFPQADVPGVSYLDPRHKDMGCRAIVDAGTVAEGTGYDTRRLAVGLADSDADIGSGALFVHEANLDLLGAVSFSKGCYVGQEVVSRTHHRGSTRSRILPVRIDGAAMPGQDIMSGDQRVGEMLSTLGQQGLALLNLQRLTDASSQLTSGDAVLKVRKPDWMELDLVIPEAAR